MSNGSANSSQQWSGNTEVAKDGVGHEAGSIAADRRHQARQGELERQGRFTTTDPLAGLTEP